MGQRPEAAGAKAVLTYGDVPGEYAAATEGAALIDETDRGELTVRGQDALAFLHRLLANDVRGLAVDAGNRNLLLSPKGKVLFDFDLARGAEGLRLSAPPGTSAALAQALDVYLFTEDVAIEETTEQHAPIDVVGPEAHAVVEGLVGAPLRLDDRSTLRFDTDLSVTRKTVAGSLGLRLEGPPARVPELWNALTEAGVRPVGIVARDILRVEAGAALFGVDVDDNVYPQEARLEDAFHLEKGCYVGQEVVAKIDTYGGLNKRLVGLSVDHDDPVPLGTRLVREEKGEARELGLVTSWAYSFVLDTGLVLAYVKRRHQELGTVFELEGSRGRAKIVELPVRS